ncbi:MAG: hypothetical protein ABII74_10120, partial [Elusimicrobiota bacterium]
SQKISIFANFFCLPAPMGAGKQTLPYLTLSSELVPRKEDTNAEKSRSNVFRSHAFRKTATSSMKNPQIA